MDRLIRHSKNIFNLEIDRYLSLGPSWMTISGYLGGYFLNNTHHFCCSSSIFSVFYIGYYYLALWKGSVYDINDDFNVILEDSNDKHLRDQDQNGYLSWFSLTWPSNWHSKISLFVENIRYFCQPKQHPWWTRYHPGWSLW